VGDRAYVPGLATAALLYLPYCAWIARDVTRGGGMRPTSVAAAAMLGGLPMAIHGYLILFRGSRLFWRRPNVFSAALPLHVTVAARLAGGAADPLSD
jgi:hypothetical protein